MHNSPALNGILKSISVQSIYKTFQSHSKEKHDMILEPLQVMVQLALLSFSPIGTKISINNNILTLQFPTISQGIKRWYNGDSKNDLYYLFHAVRRFYKWYYNQNTILFTFILTLAKKGIESLINTYKHIENDSTIHILIMYKALLETKEVLKDDYCEIDKVFSSISELYDKKTLNIIFNILQLIQKETSGEYQGNYIKGLQTVLIPINTKIHNWIQNNLAC